MDLDLDVGPRWASYPASPTIDEGLVLLDVVEDSLELHPALLANRSW
jgi:hypothetical protein